MKRTPKPVSKPRVPRKPPKNPRNGTSPLATTEQLVDAKRRRQELEDAKILAAVKPPTAEQLAEAAALEAVYARMRADREAVGEMPLALTPIMP